MSNLLQYYASEKNPVVQAIAKSVDGDVAYMGLDDDVQICIVESMYKSYQDGWNGAKLLLVKKIFD